MFSAVSVCQFVCCQFVCQHDNSRTIKRRTVGWWNLTVRYIVQKSRPSSNLGSKVKCQGHQGQKYENLLSHPHWQCMVRREPYAVLCTQQQTIPLRRSLWLTGWRQYTLAAACGSDPRGPCVRQFYAGGKISTCCLVSYYFLNFLFSGVCLFVSVSVCQFVCQHDNLFFDYFFVIFSCFNIVLMIITHFNHFNAGLQLIWWAWWLLELQARLGEVIV